MAIPFRWLTAVSLLGLLLIDGAAMAQSGPPQTLKDWFQRYDRNGDRRIDREEFQQAVVEVFYFRDKNKNGYLTADELEGAISQAVRAASRTGDGRLSMGEYVNALFKDFEAMDTDADGTLTVEEIETYIRTNRP